MGEAREQIEKKFSGAGVVPREIGLVGLGKMGASLAAHLIERGWRVVAYNRNPQPVEELVRGGVQGPADLAGLVARLSPPRLIWLMVTAGAAVDEILFSSRGLIKLLGRGDTVIDGGNSFYADSIRRARKLGRRGIRFLDVGVSGGPSGARRGACLMIGGDPRVFKQYEHLFRDLAMREGYAYLGKSGAGHFAKMVHNGIEYGMMQSLAEGFAVLKKSSFELDLARVAELYNHGSVIASRLVGWLKSGYEQYGQDLESVSGTVGHTGEGEWTVKTAKKFKIHAPVIKGALNFRVKSKRNPSYIGRILSALRNQFGGHSIK